MQWYMDESQKPKWTKSHQSQKIHIESHLIYISSKPSNFFREASISNNSKEKNGHIITNISESASLWLIRKAVDCDKDKAHGGTDNTSWCGWLPHGSFHNYSINLHLYVFSLRISTNKKQNKYINILNTWIRQHIWRKKNQK